MAIRTAILLDKNTGLKKAENANWSKGQPSFKGHYYLLHQAKIQELGVYFSWLRIRKIFKVIFLSLLIPLFAQRQSHLPHCTLPPSFYAIKCLSLNYQLWHYSSVLKCVLHDLTYCECLICRIDKSNQSVQCDH